MINTNPSHSFTEGMDIEPEKPSKIQLHSLYGKWDKDDYLLNALTYAPKKPIYTLIPACNFIRINEPDHPDYLLGWYCIEKTKMQSNISLGLPAVYGAKFLPI